MRFNVNRLWCHLRHSCIQNEDIYSRVSQLLLLNWPIQVAYESRLLSKLPESSLLLPVKLEICHIMATLDRPLPMACWEEETDRDYSLVYDFMSSLLNAELMAMRQSLYEKGLQMKHSHSCKCHAPVEKTFRDKEGAKDEIHSHKVVFDFAAVHRERALNAGKLNKDKGRRWRRKNFSKKKRD